MYLSLNNLFYSWSGIFFVHLSIDFLHTSLLLLFCPWAYCSYGVMWFFYRPWSCYRIMKLEWTSWRGHCRTSLKGDYSSGDMETGWFVILTSGYAMIQVSCMDGNSNELLPASPKPKAGLGVQSLRPSVLPSVPKSYHRNFSETTDPIIM